MADELERLNSEQREMVRRNVGLAQKISHEYAAKSSAIDIDEVVSVAYQGLIRAALKFDPSKMSAETVANGKAFSGWARRWIVGGILEWQRQVDPATRSARSLYKKLVLAGFNYESNKKNLSEYAEKLGVSVEKINEAIHSVNVYPLSLDETVEDMEGDKIRAAYGASSISPHDVEASALETTIKDSVALALEDLPILNQTVIAMRYYGHYEFQNISLELGISLTMVREIHTESVIALHQAMLQKVQHQDH